MGFLVSWYGKLFGVRTVAALLPELNLEKAVVAELQGYNRLLPPRWADLALQNRAVDVATFLRSALGRDTPPAHEEVVLARKQGRGARPLALLGLRERVLYRCLVMRINDSALVPPRASLSYDDFVSGPLAVEGCKYVLKTDVSCYYQYIDHERLVDEVVAVTGDDLAAGAAVELLYGTSGRRFGLPQLSDVSDVLAEIYIEPMRKRLARAGYSVFRYVDDFRVACPSYASALAAWEEADHAARDLGLVLNEQKTTTPSLDTYQSSLTAVRDRESEIFDSLGFDWFDFSSYADEEEEAVEADEPETLGHELPDDAAPGPVSREPREVTATQIEAARAVIERWFAEETGDGAPSYQSLVTTELVRRSLGVLSAAADPWALTYAVPLLVYAPSVTPHLFQNLMACVGSDAGEVSKTLDAICNTSVVGVWQSVWVAHVAGYLPRHRRTPGGSMPAHAKWLRQHANGNGTLAGEALVSLARRRVLSIGDAKSAVERLSELARPLGVIATALVGRTDAVADVARDRLDSWRAEWAVEHL